MLKPKVGDLVRLKPLLVERVEPGLCSDVLVAGGITLNRNYVEEILPRPIQVGDRVRWRNAITTRGCAAVKSVDNGDVWLLWDDGTRETARAALLAKIDDA